MYIVLYPKVQGAKPDFILKRLLKPCTYSTTEVDVSPDFFRA